MNHSLIQRPVSITQETPRGGGLDSFPKKKEDKIVCYSYILSIIIIIIIIIIEFNSTTIQTAKSKEFIHSTFVKIVFVFRQKTLVRS